MHGWMDRWMDDRQKVITIAHPEHSSGELKMSIFLRPSMILRVIYGTQMSLLLHYDEYIHIWVVIKVHNLKSCIQSSYLHLHHMAFIEEYVNIFGPCAHANVASVCLEEICCPSNLSLAFRSLRKAYISISAPSEGNCFTFTISRS